MSTNESPTILPSTNPEQFASFVLMSDGEVFGHITLHVQFSESMVAGFRSPNLTALEIPVNSGFPVLFSTWNGEEFIPPTT